jgi:hypothetical protein
LSLESPSKKAFWRLRKRIVASHIIYPILPHDAFDATNKCNLKR